MLKYIVIMVLVGYVLSKIVSLLFRVTQHTQRPTPNFRRPPDGNIHVDSVPKKGKKNGLKGGDYVDYEEVK